MGISTSVYARYGYLYKTLGDFETLLEYPQGEVWFDGDEDLRTLKSLLTLYSCEIDYTDPITGDGYYILYYTGNQGTNPSTECFNIDYVTPEWEVNTNIPQPVRLLDIDKTVGNYGLGEIKKLLEKSGIKPVAGRGWWFIVSQW